VEAKLERLESLYFNLESSCAMLITACSGSGTSSPRVFRGMTLFAEFLRTIRMSAPDGIDLQSTGSGFVRRIL
jgi:hypothetical protein